MASFEQLHTELLTRVATYLDDQGLCRLSGASSHLTVLHGAVCEERFQEFCEASRLAAGTASSSEASSLSERSSCPVLASFDSESDNY